MSISARSADNAALRSLPSLTASTSAGMASLRKIAETNRCSSTSTWPILSCIADDCASSVLEKRGASRRLSAQLCRSHRDAGHFPQGLPKPLRWRLPLALCSAEVYRTSRAQSIMSSFPFAFGDNLKVRHGNLDPDPLKSFVLLLNAPWVALFVLFKSLPRDTVV